MHLTVSLTGSGHHPAAWRVSPLPAHPNAATLQAMACTAERGGLDAVLLGLPAEMPADCLARANTMILDPLPLLGSLIAVTNRIGLGAAWTVDYTEPYHVARVFATLDHLSYGRTAWIASMFGTASLVPRIGRPAGPEDPPAYCARAGEFIDVAKQLWDSWEDEAFALDKPSGMFVDPERVYPIQHVGAFFSVRGPLNVPRPPQGNPVLVLHDPSTAAARPFVASTADVVLMDCASLPDAVARYRDLRALAGRDTDVLRILANMVIVLDESELVAQQRAATPDAMIPPLPGSTARFVGTPDQLVTTLLVWHEQHACDGFNFLPAVMPHDLDQLVDAVFPRLQRHGLRPAAYPGATLREHLGLPRPRSQFATRAPMGLAS
jgi:alkanesulfonate monooxygenase SsuD/methylene tetrahydromethanopterin reductase-like flavin-dependent oxidoreductase (luciferase family)